MNATKTATTTKIIDRELIETELRDEELEHVAGGDGPPSTAGDGNGRTYLRS
jgi:hypothetical protein